jgi:hypothetical protein
MKGRPRSRVADNEYKPAAWARERSRAADKGARMRDLTSRAQLRLLPLALLVPVAVPAPGQSAAAVRAARSDLCVTEGALETSADGSLVVSASKMRAFATLPVADSAEVRFTWLGPTASESRLGSGEVRQQFGLKLRALDACNLVYVMWRLAPESKLVVQVKSNPGEHTSRECGNRGYRTVRPRQAAAPPVPESGATHVLRARIEGTQLLASVDGRDVWQGDFAGSAAVSAGPVGVRSDNAHVAFTLWAGPGPQLGADQLPVCRPGPEESE